MQPTKPQLLLLLALAAHQAGSMAPPQQQPVIRDPVKYDRGDCLYETVVCLRDDSCGPLLRLVHAYCYETPEYQQDMPDGSRLACDSSCAALLSVLFNTSAGLKLRECNYSSYQFWTELVIHKQSLCTPLLARTDRLLQRALAGSVRTECWLAGLLCASDFSCRSTLMSVLDLPCYDGPCSPECAARLTNFGSMFSQVFHMFLSCLCGQELAAACPTLPSGYLSNRSSALDGLSFGAPLDRLIEQLGREAIREQMTDSIWLLRVFEHHSYCRSLKTIIGEPNCVPRQQPQPTVSEPLCTLESVYLQPSTTAAPTTTPSSTQTSATSSTSRSSTQVIAASAAPALRTQSQMPDSANPRGAPVRDVIEPEVVTGAPQQLACITLMLLLWTVTQLAANMHCIE